MVSGSIWTKYVIKNMEGKVENRVIRMHDIHDVMHRALHNYLHRLMGRMSQALKKAENVAK